MSKMLKATHLLSQISERTVTQILKYSVASYSYLKEQRTKEEIAGKSSVNWSSDDIRHMIDPQRMQLTLNRKKNLVNMYPAFSDSYIIRNYQSAERTVLQTNTK